jgi:hypothetical protein
VSRVAAVRWSRSPERAALLALYAEVDGLLQGWSCDCSDDPQPLSNPVPCCHFAVTGREPYPTAVELEEVRHAARAAGVAPGSPGPIAKGRRLPVVELRACPLLSPEGRCRIYASRPFGCRTFFCGHAQPPLGARRKLPRDEVNALGRRVADLSGRFAPRDPGPRPLVRALLSEHNPGR